MDISHKSLLRTAAATFLLSLALASAAEAAPRLVINELSQGTAGAREYFELVLLGDVGQETGTANVDGWIIDDNNGDFGSGAGTGIATGHLRLDSSRNPLQCGSLAAMPIGSRLVIYNDADKDAGVPAAGVPSIGDFNDSDGDGVYWFPVGGTSPTAFSSPCISLVSAGPLIGSPTYPSGPLLDPETSGAAWSVALANATDAAQVRTPAGSFVHGFSFGSNPAGLSFNVPASGAGLAYAMSCGNYFQYPPSAGNYNPSIPAASQTPGAPNDQRNANMLRHIEDGTYRYTDPSNVNNCHYGPDLQIAFAAPLVNVGVATQMTITVSNPTVANGGLALTGLALSDALPSGLEIASVPNAATTCTGGSLSAPAGTTTLSLTGASLGVGSSCQITLDVVAQQAGLFANTVSPGDFSNTQGIDATGPDTDSMSAIAPDFSVTKTASGSFVRGGLASFDIEVENVGAGHSVGRTTVTDTMPAGLTAIGASGAGWSCIVSSGTVTCTNGSAVAAGATLPTLTINVQVDTLAPGSATNTGSVSAAYDTVATNDDDSATVTIVDPAPPVTTTVTTPGATVTTPVTTPGATVTTTTTTTVPVTPTSPARLAVKHLVSKRSARMGDTLVLRVTATNVSGVTATDAVLRTTIGRGQALYQKTLVAQVGDRIRRVQGTLKGQIVTWNLGTLEPEQRVTVTFNTRLTAGDVPRLVRSISRADASNAARVESHGYTLVREDRQGRAGGVTG